MYAVYRERSLVFVERYIDPAGQEQQTIKYSGPWNVWSDYPIQYGTAGNSQVTRQGYSLVGWYVNGTTTSAPVYPSTKEAYAISNSLFKATAEQLGTYDIMVYTVYAAQVERNVTMNSKTDPVTTDLTVDSYTLPASMQNGKVTMSLSMGNPALQLVSKEEMEAHAYDSTWTTGGVQYSAENTAALLVTISKGTDTKTMDLSKAVNDTLDFGKEMEAGWQITLTLYHSKVISADNTYTFDLKVNFASSGSGENTLKDQFINNHVSIRLQPTIYTVNYSVKLPEKAGQLTVGSWGDFTQPDGTDAVEVTKQVKQAYGSDLISNLIQIEGYEPASDLWIYNSEAAAYTKAVMKVSAANNEMLRVVKQRVASILTVPEAFNKKRLQTTLPDDFDVRVISQHKLENLSVDSSEYHIGALKPKAVKSVYEPVATNVVNKVSKRVVSGHNEAHTPARKVTPTQSAPVKESVEIAHQTDTNLSDGVNIYSHSEDERKHIDMLQISEPVGSNKQDLVLE